MTKKAARRKPAKKRPSLPAKPLREHFSGKGPPAIPSHSLLFVVEEKDSDSWAIECRPRTEIEGVPLPPDLDQAIAFYARREFASLQQALTVPVVAESESGEIFEDTNWQEASISDSGWKDIRGYLESCFRAGFFLAVMRYADDLKHVPEAAALIEKEQARKETARRNGKVRAEKAAPTHKAIRKRFRELRKTIPQKTARYFRLAKEFAKSDRQIARIVDGID